MLINWNRMNIQTSKLRYFLYRLMLGARLKKKYISNHSFKRCDWFLCYLFEMGLIKNYKIINQSRFIVEIAYDKRGNSVIHGIKWLQRNKAMYSHSFRRIFKKIKSRVPIYAFVDTRWGFIPLHVCLQNRIGGYLILWIY